MMCNKLASTCSYAIDTVSTDIGMVQGLVIRCTCEHKLCHDSAMLHMPACNVVKTSQQSAALHIICRYDFCLRLAPFKNQKRFGEYLWFRLVFGLVPYESKQHNAAHMTGQDEDL